MARILSITFAIAFGGTSALQAQDAPWQFQWKTGQILNYRVQHTTTVTEVVAANKVESRSKLNLVKRWQVMDVDAQGLATLHMSLASMRHEQSKPGGAALLFDSDDAQKTTPELKEMSKFVGKTLAIIRIDRFGRLHEVKLGTATKYEAEPPFVVVLPSVAPKEGQAWLRPFTVTLEPPQGAGEKHPAQHKYVCTKLADGKATLSLVTEFKKAPENIAERLPLLQRETEGKVVFDIRAGRLVSATLAIDKTIENHQGAGSSYQFVSTYTEELTGP